MRFNTRAELSEHYRSEFHKTNLVLFSNHQPILTLEQFLAKKAEQAEENAKKEAAEHKHKEIVEEEEDDGEFDESQCRDIPATECLFCGQTFENEDIALEHMSSHGFRFPYPEKLKDRKGLMEYLGEKVGVGNCCVYCSRQFKSLSAVRDHMRGKSHCAISFDEELEDYYAPETGICECNYYIDENDEMHLPNGKIIGHKKYQRYYKQNIRPVEEIMKGRRLPIEGPKKPRESITEQNDPILRKREYYHQKYISKRERRLVSKTYHPFSDIHRGNAT
ncbi:Zinc finger, C2H2 type family protein [Histomonas meleagridis]|uniref:zinc finger protein, C2H2 type family protein n=1 Tax=Histomonas meleagridis TaxID=135588 RepID=UPI00355A5757|nr:Zinc finger, C2H2 type family protein [Histomonas meleagridis]KAH0803013.1 zinc finger protein, C2H2 type family protein [Histomonas meleagridis]